MQALKVLVVVLGVLIIAGVAVVAVTVVNRSGHDGSFGAKALTLPKGCHLVGMVGAGNRVALRLGDSADCQVILFVDPDSGQQTGSLALQPQP